MKFKLPISGAIAVLFLLMPTAIFTAGAASASPVTATTIPAAVAAGGHHENIASPDAVRPHATGGPFSLCVAYQEVSFSGGLGAHSTVGFTINADVFSPYFDNDTDPNNSNFLVVDTNIRGTSVYVTVLNAGSGSVPTQTGFLGIFYSC